MNKIFKYGTMLFIAFNIIQFSNKKKIEDLCMDLRKRKVECW